MFQVILLTQGQKPLNGPFSVLSFGYVFAFSDIFELLYGLMIWNKKGAAAYDNCSFFNIDGSKMTENYITITTAMTSPHFGKSGIEVQSDLTGRFLDTGDGDESAGLV